MPAKITYENFKQLAKEKFGNNIDLTLIDKDNFNYSDKQPIKCLIHNEIIYRYPKLLLKNKSICNKCNSEILSNVKFIKRKYKGKYSILTFADYKNIITDKFPNIKLIDTFNDTDRIYRNTLLKFYCENHGEYKNKAYVVNDNKWCGCEQCRREYNSNELIKQGEIRRSTFIEDAINMHGKQYDYSNVNINGKLSKVDIVCSKHGIFKMYPSIHLRGEGCPMCNQDKLNCERRLGELLKMHFPNINIVQQYHGILGRQSLDYFMPDYKIGIEYQGSQHFENNEYLNDYRHNLEKTQNLDYKKYNKCKENNIKIFYFTFSKEFANIQYIDKLYFNIFELCNDINEYINNIGKSSVEQQ